MLATAALCMLPLPGCDEEPDNPDMPDAGLPDAPPPDGPDPDAGPTQCQLPATGANDEVKPNVITYNQLGTSSLMFNALSTNPQAIARMLGNKLHTETYDTKNHPDTADAYLVDQLADPWAERLMSYLVACALPVDKSVSWHDPMTGESRTWHGERGFCPAWSQAGIAGDTACQELVSACVLARNNAFERNVRISMRGVKDDQGFGLSEVVPGGVPAGLDSVKECTEPAAGDVPTARNCGWSVEQAGVCFYDTPVVLESSCESDVMLRVCEGTSACDAGDAQVVSTARLDCQDGQLEFDCPATGSFTVMSAPVEPGQSPPVSLQAESALYPVTEQRFYYWREGAFYGNLFSVESMDERLAVHVQDSKIYYSFAPDTQTPRQDYPVYDLACNAVHTSPETRLLLRSGLHDDFLENMAPFERFVIHQNLYACWDPGWEHGPAYAAKRICAGPEGREVCAAQAVDQCWVGLNASNNLCDTEDSTIAERDRDYDRCRDASGTVWEHPITVFLEDPCAIVPDECQTRQTASLAAGPTHTCVALGTGQVRCWGDNISGQLGYGPIDRDDDGSPDSIGDDETPASAGDVDLGGSAIQVATGGSEFYGGHTCALRDNGTVQCWGSNGSGQLGYGYGEEPSPEITELEMLAVAPEVDIGGPVSQIAAGGYHTCALLDDGALRCWGENGLGQLGYGHTDNIGDDWEEVPATAGDVQVGGTIRQLALGGEHTCALLGNGKVRCWGRNFSGQLGYAHTSAIGDDEGEVPATVGDVDVGGTVSQISAGHNHTCAVLAETRTLRCWGNNDGRQLGFEPDGENWNIGDDEHPWEAGDVPLAGAVLWVDAGYYRTCVVLDTGHVQCWGEAPEMTIGQTESASAQRGHGPRLHTSNARTLVEMSTPPLGARAVQVTVGLFHHCALLETGAIQCWGENYTGQLGYGHGEDIDNPVIEGNVPIF